MRYFKRKEFECRCCGGLPLEAEQNVSALVREVLDPVREAFGKPIVVNSGYRCPKHNREVGGVPASQHLRGEAADIRPREVGKIIERLGRYDQLIYYPRFVHVSWKRNGGNRKQIIYKH